MSFAPLPSIVLYESSPASWGEGREIKGHDLTLPPAWGTPSRQGIPARRGGGQWAGCPARAHLRFAGHGREPAGFLLPHLELWFILERPTQLHLPSENSTGKNFRPGQAGLLGLAKAKVIPKPERATRSLSTDFALSALLRNILRSEEEEIKPSKGELRTSLRSWVLRTHNQEGACARSCAHRPL